MKTYEESFEYIKWQIIFALEDECNEKERHIFMKIYGKDCENIQQAVLKLESDKIKSVYELVYRTTKCHE